MRLYKSILFVFSSLHIISQTPNWQWAKNAGNTASENASGIATDNLGNSYVCGYYFSSSFTIGTATLTNNGNYDLYIAKYDNSGNPIWARSFGGTFDDNANAVAIDASGNVYVTGFFISPTMVCGTTTLTNSAAGDIFILKFDSSGNLIWAKNMGDGGTNQGNAIATDGSGNVFITGQYNSTTLTFGTYTLTSNGNDDMFVAKYDGNGNVMWALSAGDNFSDVGNGITCDATGNVFVTGYFKSSTMALGTTTLVNASATSADLFVLKLSNNGTILTANSTGDIFDEIGYGITADVTGNVIMTGAYFSPTLTIGTSTLTNYGSRDVLTIKCDNSCNFIWARGAGGNSDDYGYGIDTDASGNIYVNGHNHSFLFTHGTYTVSMMGGVGDGFLAAFSSAGTALWLDDMGGGGDDGWNALSTDGAGNLYCAGYFASTSVTLGTTNLVSGGSADLLLAKANTSNGMVYYGAESDNVFSLYPNPSSGEFFVKPLRPSDRIKVEVYNSVGHLVYIEESTDALNKVGLSGSAAGMYFVRLTTDNTSYTKKLILN